MGIESLPCSSMKTWNGSCILGVIVGDSLDILSLLAEE